MRLATTTLLGLTFGASLGACLPSFPEGERAVTCWTDHLVQGRECDKTLTQCIERVGNDPLAFDTCFVDLDRCHSRALETVQACERRTGCIARYDACIEDCSFDSPVDCFGECFYAFERCAPWFEADCERECAVDEDTCLVLAPSSFEVERCEDEGLDCALDCYDAG